MSVEKQKPIKSGYAPKTPAAVVIKGVDLSGKNAIVTGGGSGIGVETVRSLAGAGASVIVPARSVDKAKGALKGVNGNVAVAGMDLGDLASIKRFADGVLRAGKPLHILINNAGVMACPETRVGPGWEAQFGTNHLGHFALTTALLPLLEKANGARVVSLSSVAHKRSPILWDDIHFKKSAYEKWTAYGQAKTANSLFALALDARFKARGVRAFAVHPGGIMTPLQRHLTQDEMIAFGWLDKDGKPAAAAAAIFKTPQEGASTSVWCATSKQLDGKGGVYCEDLDIGEVMTEASPRYAHVAPHAVDEAAAERLWKVSEEMLAAA
jgi:NAD(P)-dependent dehydrogenase (short-subunit alcohol dehydrogenase family)